MSVDNKQENRDPVTEPINDNRLINPIDRISEIIFGVIMALTFTCSVSVIETDKAEVKELLLGAITCNIAWGLVDAVIFLIMTMIEEGRGLTVYKFVRKSKQKEKSIRFIKDALPPVIASVMSTDEIENIRNKLLKLPEPPAVRHLSWIDYKTAIGIFLLVFISTFPVAIPFLFINNLQAALRTSNFIAILIMFISGFILGRYAGRNRYLVGAMMSIIGIILVVITILLGG